MLINYDELSPGKGYPSIKDNGKSIRVNGKNVQFGYTVDTVLQFPQCWVVLLMEDDVPDNNVIAVDHEGNPLWNISQIIRLPYSEAYVSLSKESETTISVVSYSGVKFTIDLASGHVVGKAVTK